MEPRKYLLTQRLPPESKRVVLSEYISDMRPRLISDRLRESIGVPVVDFEFLRANLVHSNVIVTKN